MLRIILCALRPLTVTELRYAIAFGSEPRLLSQKKMQESETLPPDDEVMKKQIRSRCGGLLEVVVQQKRKEKIGEDEEWEEGEEGSEDGGQDEEWEEGEEGSEDGGQDEGQDEKGEEKEERRIVQFMHQSVKDFLLQDSGFQILDPGSETTRQLAKGHDYLSQSCVQYLTISELEEMPEPLAGLKYWQIRGFKRLTDFFLGFPLASYAAVYWYKHCQEAEKLGISQFRQMNAFKETCQSNHEVWRSVYRSSEPVWNDCQFTARI